MLGLHGTEVDNHCPVVCGRNAIRNCVLGVEDFIFQMIYWLCSENVYADIMIYFLVPD